jgi:hypothetical protein
MTDYPHGYDDMMTGSDRWRITIERGPFQGVRRFTVWLHDEGHCNGGHAAWYACGGSHALELRYAGDTANLMLDLLDTNFLTASADTERLAVELLHRNGYSVPDRVLARVYPTPVIDHPNA